MIRLLKLMAYGLLGYVLYEFFRGIAQEADESAAGQTRGEGRNLRSDPMRANMTGPGRGEDTMTQEFDGGSVRHAVGRGVVS